MPTLPLLLSISDGYDPAISPVVSNAAAQLDALLATLTRRVEHFAYHLGQIGQLLSLHRRFQGGVL